jgi:hypothetical protein
MSSKSCPRTICKIIGNTKRTVKRRKYALSGLEDLHECSQIAGFRFNTLLLTRIILVFGLASSSDPASSDKDKGQRLTHLAEHNRGKSTLYLSTGTFSHGFVYGPAVSYLKSKQG